MSKYPNHECAFYFICKDNDCLKKGAKDIYKTLKKCLKEENRLKSSRVVKTRCMGGCKNAPVAFFGQKWVTNVKQSDVKKMVKENMKEERLKI